ncbi:MAG: amino acid adenylation domain-containing protein [Brasilonema angustatum HA4187-MV1]|jgi:amino acid adenylation domain-containing protein/non-ribosomal peptide synthase protein (TIGR01720 family)|nr:amino acid adenylation domain-containing protein [Brasilonema angustatum HA4187-MV1]
MITEEFLANLQTKGVKIWIDGDQLGCRAPKGVMTAAIQQELKERKTEILAFLKEAQTATQSTSFPLMPVARDRELPLSFAQQRMWFLHELDKESPFYNESLQVRIVGKLSVIALEQSINEIIRRHEALRTTFAVREGIPFQAISPTFALAKRALCAIAIPVVDLQNFSPTSLQQIVTQEVRKPFDLGIAPLLRATLLRQEAESHLLILTIHHIITDGWSMGIFFKELETLYHAFTKGEPNPLPELKIQYADFALWQRNWFTNEVQQKQLEYWKQQLAGAPPLLELPTDYPRPPVQTFSGATKKFQIEEHLTSQLATLSQKSGVTLFMTLLAAFAILLHRYSGQDDICIGSPFANRNRQECESLIGCFVNTLVLRTQIEDNPSFSQFLEQVRSVVWNAHAHQDVPFEQVVEALQPERSLGYNPLFQVVFVLENFSLDTLELPDISLTPEMVERGTSQFDLSLSIWQTQKGLIGSWEYNSDLFEADTIARMTLHFQTLLETIVSDPYQKVGELTLLTESQRHQLLVEWNDTQTNYPQDKCIHQLFEEQVQRTPDAVAVVFGNQQLTYQQLNTQANQLAHYLRSLGVKADVLVGICVERSPLMIVGMLGILKAGGAYVPLDPAYPQERLAFMLEDAQVSVLLTQESLVKTLPPHKAQVICLDSEVALSTSTENFTHTTTTDNLAYVIYTSGSTGRPKGVQIEHRGLLNLVFWHQQAFAVSSCDRATQVAGVAFDACGWEIWPYLAVGASIYFPDDETRIDPEQLRDWMLSQAITISFLPTPMAEKMLSLTWPENSALRTLLTGGDQLHQYPLDSHPFEVVNNYGPTENTVVTTSGIVPKKQQTYLSPTIGRAIANTQVYILDSLLQPVPIGVAGELYISGESLARGYLNRPGLTAERFICNPFAPEGRVYRTGDLVRYQADGNIEYLGRIDNQVKIRGFRIELPEIEATLTQHPQVREAVAIVREDILSVKSLAAYIIPELAQPTSNELRQFLKSKLPSYMVPASFTFLEVLPITPNGKVDRRALPVPEFESDESTGFVSPHTHTQEVLAKIWQEILLLKQVGIHDNFFELGGDSIISMQIIAKANQYGLKLTPKQIFQHQTIAELASVAGTINSVQSEQGLVTGFIPLTPVLHWFFERNLPELHHFNQSFLLEVPANLLPELLEQALRKLVYHHDALRLRFVQQDGQWQQYNSDAWNEVSLVSVDLSHLPQAEQLKAIANKAEEAQRMLNLADGPLMRVVLFQLGYSPGRLLIVIHHTAVDGISWRILLEDLSNAYKQLEIGKSIQLPAKTTSFKDWAMRLQDYARSQELRSQLDYWQDSMQFPTASLPLDYTAVAQDNTVASSQIVSAYLSVEQTRALLQDVPSAYNTQINDVLLTALVQTFTRWTSSPSLLIDLEGHGREDLFEDVDLSRTVGWFTSIFPVLLKLENQNNLGEVLKSVKEQLRRIPNKGIGYGILRYLSIDESDSVCVAPPMPNGTLPLSGLALLRSRSGSERASADRHQLQALAQAQVSFNYFGQYDQTQLANLGWKYAQESSGSIHSSKGQRHHLLNMNGIVVDGKLKLEWQYSEKFHRRETIKQLAHEYIEALEAIISHCFSPEEGGYTPSDFPDVEFSQEGLDELLAEID